MSNLQNFPLRGHTFVRCKTNIYRNALIPIIFYILTKSVINSQFVSHSHQHCFSFMLQYFLMETRLAQTRKVLITDFLFFFSFKKKEKTFSGIKLFLNCSKNPWWMKFNFLIKNVTSNFTKYGAAIVRCSHRRCS